MGYFACQIKGKKNNITVFDSVSSYISVAISSFINLKKNVNNRFESCNFLMESVCLSYLD